MQTAMMVRVALMAALTAVSAQIVIPLPFSPVPFTLQVPVVILSGLLLGVRYGALAQLVYVLIGAVGAPVFALFSGGLGVILGPTGGYLMAYPLAAAVAGLAAGAAVGSNRRRALAFCGGAGLGALAIIYAGGVLWLSFQTQLPLGVAVVQGVLPFVVFDLVKVAVAALTATATAPQIAPARS